MYAMHTYTLPSKLLKPRNIMQYVLNMSQPTDVIDIGNGHHGDIPEMNMALRAGETFWGLPGGAAATRRSSSA